MKKFIKRMFFSLIVVALIFVIVTIIKVGKFEDLEGYMYSLAAEITATDSNATTSNATSSNVYYEFATTPNATSSNIPEISATSSNATSSNVDIPTATTSNATTPNATTTNVEIPKRNDTDVLKTQNKVTNDVNEVEDEPENEVKDYVSIEKENVILEENKSEIENEVSFLESKKVYIMILAGSLLVIIIVSIILVLDKNAKNKAEKNIDTNNDKKDSNN